MTGKQLPLILFAAALSCSAAAADTAAKPAAGVRTDAQKFSYLLGFQAGQDIKQRNLDVDPRVFAQGMRDALSGKASRLAPEEIRAVVAAQRQKEWERHEALMRKNQEASRAFLEANGKKHGVVTLPSGLQYRVIQEGRGKQPKTEDTVVVHYRGTLINGTEFDSSYQRNEPAIFSVDNVIKGWQEVLPLMQEGAKWQIYVPPELAYGAHGGGAIGPNETLIFDIELLTINPAEQTEKKEAPKEPKS